MISLYRLPILLVVEENDIAQTTNTKETISGNIFDKCKNFTFSLILLAASLIRSPHMGHVMVYKS